MTIFKQMILYACISESRNGKRRNVVFKAEKLYEDGRITRDCNVFYNGWLPLTYPCLVFITCKSIIRRYCVVNVLLCGLGNFCIDTT